MNLIDCTASSKTSASSSLASGQVSVHTPSRLSALLLSGLSKLARYVFVANTKISLSHKYLKLALHPFNKAKMCSRVGRSTVIVSFALNVKSCDRPLGQSSVCDIIFGLQTFSDNDLGKSWLIWCLLHRIDRAYQIFLNS